MAVKHSFSVSYCAKLVQRPTHIIRDGAIFHVQQQKFFSQNNELCTMLKKGIKSTITSANSHKIQCSCQQQQNKFPKPLFIRQKLQGTILIGMAKILNPHLYYITPRHNTKQCAPRDILAFTHPPSY